MRSRHALTALGAAVVSFFMISFMPSVAANDPPTISVGDFTGVMKLVAWPFSVTASDPDGDPLRYTWDWGDGNVDVTTVPTATHVYVWVGVFVLTVYADDLTGIPGHNVSDTGYVQVLGCGAAPYIVSWCVSNANPYEGEEVTFTASACDKEGDPLRFTFSFGDGTYAVEQAGHTAPGTLVTVSVNKSYDDAGPMTAMIYVWDFCSNASGTPLYIDVLPNAAPIVMPLLDLWGVVDEALTFEADAFDPDPMDVLTFTWDFGDGAPLVVGNPAIHSYTSTGVYQYRVWVDDGHGYNVTVGARVTIGEISFTLNLLTGWNLVTVPLVGHSYTAASLGLPVWSGVAGYNPTTKTYDKMYYVGISPPSEDFDLEPCVGYWISVPEDMTINLVGYQVSGMAYTFVDIPAGGGWAILGVPSLDTGVMASDVAAMYEGVVTAVAMYDAETKTYETYYPDWPFDDFEVTPGSGVWLWCATGEWFTYAA